MIPRAPVDSDEARERREAGDDDTPPPEPVCVCNGWHGEDLLGRPIPCRLKHERLVLTEDGWRVLPRDRKRTNRR